MPHFSHLHVHTQYSILDGASNIGKLIAKVKEDGMGAVAITDHGNMFGVKEFFNEAKKQGVKPILGCETYVARRGRHMKESKEDRSGFHLILLAKNRIGYHNLIKLISYSWTEGHYYKPRIDWELLEEYHEGLIASSACIAGEIPRAIYAGKMEEAEEVIQKFKKTFGQDFYLEMQRHETTIADADTEVYEKQKIVNEKIVQLAQQYDVKYIATNDVHFVNAEDAEPHDRLICLTTNAALNDVARLRYTKQEWLKTTAEMSEIFSDMPEALENTQEIVGKIEEFDLNQKPIMPDFPLPDGFDNEDVYLRHISYQGAAIRYLEIADDIRERIDFELDTIKKMGFPGYFLIVWDILKAAREMGVSVGPGRGSAAGSVVAYCLRITDIDPLRYNLLFERFLNPDRISMPDVDIDFDDDGREKVLNWVEEKYDHNRVANIITFGTMAAKSSIRDVARVQNLNLGEANRLAKLVPERPGVTLKEAYKEVPELAQAKSSGSKEISSVLKYAEVLEGSVRHTGVHACGIIISKDDLINYIPVATSKDSHLLVTQYDGKHVESVGMLKMDFLGLKTLSIIKDTLINIKLSKGIDLALDTIPLDDSKTYELYSKGETTGLFQFESDGMKKYLKELKPSKFEDLIAMNALYRPGPIGYIPDFISRKHDRTKIEYDFPIMREVLEETYGITVYQEQVMQLSRIMAGFTRGEADSLRKAMGKKIQSMMDELKPKFVEGCLRLHGYPESEVQKVWNDWEDFAKYAFNKSHATCYSYISYQTGYLKAHYPAEFMAAVLSRNQSDIKKVTFFMNECKRMGIKVLGPDVNESNSRFTVNKDGHIRFGLNAIKGVGEGAVLNIIENRKKNVGYNDIFNFMESVNLQSVNKRCLESLAFSGAFDCLGLDRNQFFGTSENDIPFLEILIKFGNKVQGDKNNHQQSLFGAADTLTIAKPKCPVSQPWDAIYRLAKEKEMTGVYLSAHPLDDHKYIIDNICNITLEDLNDLSEITVKDVTVAGFVTAAEEKTTKNRKPYGVVTLVDYFGSYDLRLFSNDYLDFKKYFTIGYPLLIKGKAQPRAFGTNPAELEFKVNSISMLADAWENVQSISLKIPVHTISNNLIEDITKVSEANKGKTQLKFLIFDPTDKVWVEMFSRSHRVNISNEIIDYFENNTDIEVKIH